MRQERLHLASGVTETIFIWTPNASLGSFTGRVRSAAALAVVVKAATIASTA